MPAAYVKNLLAGSRSGSSAALVLSGSVVVSLGNTIALVYGASSSAGAISIVDNLGNVYALVSSARDAGNNVWSQLYLAPVTNPGTLTSITITHPVTRDSAGIATEFTGLGSVKATGQFVAGSSGNDTINAYPGGTLGTTAAYTPGDIWLGAFAIKDLYNFQRDASGVAAIEPVVEQKPGFLSLGFLYYLSASPITSALVGRFLGSNYTVGAGAVVGPAGGPTYNDTAVGIVGLSGTRTESYLPPIIRSDAPTGAFKLSGSVVESIARGYADAPTGTLTLAGTCISAHAKGYADNPTGKITLGGTAATASQRDGAPVGIFKLSGFTSASAKEYTDTCAGVLALIGVASETIAYFDAQTGKVLVNGTAADTHLIVASDAVSGTLRLSGSANEFIDVDGQVIYDDRPVHAMAISGRLITPSERLDLGIGGIGTSSETRLKGGRVVTSLTGRLRT